MRAPTQHGLGLATVSVDSSCASTSLRIWDDFSYSGNEICFVGSGNAALDDFGWNQRVRSWKSGDYSGHWYDGSQSCGGGLTPQYVAPGVDFAIASPCVADATNLIGLSN